MGTIQIRNLTFGYSNQKEPLFDNVSLNIDTGWKLGLIGRNGRGKTTLLRLLQGKLKGHGEIQTKRDFYYFPVEIKQSQLSTKNVIMKASGRDYSNLWEVEREMELLNLREEILDQPFNQLSPGLQTKVQLAITFANQNGFQLLDEPTNHLDQSGRKQLANYLEQKNGFIVVSHDRQFLNQIVNHVLAINRSDIEVFKGNYDTWLTNYEETQKRELREKDQLKQDIKKLKQAAYQKQEWARATERKKVGAYDKGFMGHKAAKVMGRAMAVKQRADHKIVNQKKLLKNIEVDDELAMNYVPLQKLSTLIEVKNLVTQRDGKQINRPISFVIKAGERLILSGKNGSGKSTMIHAILDQPGLIQSGEVQIKSGLKVSYLTQEFEEMSGTISQMANHYQIDVQDMYSTLRKLGFERELFQNDIGKMSMGQKRKVALARALCQEANLYVWDEPLNYLDVISREQVEKMINRVRPTMLVIDHDIRFTNAIESQKMTVFDVSDN